MTLGVLLVLAVVLSARAEEAVEHGPTAISLNADDPRAFDAQGLLDKLKIVNGAVLFLHKKMGEKECVAELKKRSRAPQTNWVQELVLLYDEHKGPEANLGLRILEMAEKTAPIAKDPTGYAALVEKLKPASMEEAVAQYKTQIDTVLLRLQNEKIPLKELLPELMSPTLGEELFLAGAKAEGARANARYHELLNKIYEHYHRKRNAIAAQLGVSELFALDYELAK